MFSVKMLCVNNHLTCWNSQPLIKNITAGNLLSSAAILFSGNTFSHIAQFSILSEFEVLQPYHILQYKKQVFVSYGKQSLERGKKFSIS